MNIAHADADAVPMPWKILFRIIFENMSRAKAELLFKLKLLI